MGVVRMCGYDMRVVSCEVSCVVMCCAKLCCDVLCCAKLCCAKLCCSVPAMLCGHSPVAVGDGRVGAASVGVEEELEGAGDGVLDGVAGLVGASGDDAAAAGRGVDARDDHADHLVRIRIEVLLGYEKGGS